MRKKEKRKKKRPIYIRVILWATVTSAATAGISYMTKGLWEPKENIHFIEFATMVLTLAEEA